LYRIKLIVLDTVQDRFPDLIDFAQSQVPLIKQSAMLRKLIRDLQHVPDETTVIRAFKAAKQGT
jgi:type III secretory pathway component EscV